MNGQKVWITAVPEADYILTIARTTPASQAGRRWKGLRLFMIDQRRAGGDVERPCPKVGTRCISASSGTSTTSRCARTGWSATLDMGWRHLVDTLNTERLVTAAGCLATADLVSKIAADYASERVVFGRPIGSNQGIQFPLAELKMRVEAARVLTYKAAWEYDSGDVRAPPPTWRSTSPSRSASDAADQAIQTLGGYGLSASSTTSSGSGATRASSALAPVANELILSFVGQHVLGLPRSYEMSLSRIVEHHADRLGERPVLAHGDQVVTFAELASRARRTAGALASLGVRRGDVVAVLLLNSLEFVDVMLGTDYLGAVFMPLDWRLAAPEVTYIVVHAGASVLVTEPELERLSSRTVSCTVARAQELPTPAEPVAGPVPTAPGDLLRLMYTSGTTARPKGVMITHGNLDAKAPPTSPSSASGARIAASSPARSTTSGLSTSRSRPCSIWAVSSGSCAASPPGRPRRNRARWDDNRLARPGDGQAPARGRVAARPRPVSMRSIIDGGEKMPLPLIDRLLAAFPGAWFAGRVRPDRDGERRHVPEQGTGAAQARFRGQAGLQRRPAGRAGRRHPAEPGEQARS